MSCLRASCLTALVGLTLLGTLSSGCRDRRFVDPDGRDRDHAPAKNDDLAAELRDISLKEVVGAVGGVTVREAPAVLERWLAAGPTAVLLPTWPRRADGALDLDRAPIAAISVEGEVSRATKSSCGDVTAVFAGASGPAVKMKLTIPATSRTCRDPSLDRRLHDHDAIRALHDAIAAARVPVAVPPPVLANAN